MNDNDMECRGIEAQDVLPCAGLRWLIGVDLDTLLPLFVRARDDASRAANEIVCHGGSFDQHMLFFIKRRYVEALGFPNNSDVEDVIGRIFKHIGHCDSGPRAVLLALKTIAESVKAGNDFDFTTLRRSASADCSCR